LYRIHDNSGNSPHSPLIPPPTGNDALEHFIAVLAERPPCGNRALSYLQKHLMTISDAAAEPKCSSDAILDRIEKGELLAVAIGTDTLLVSRRRVARLRDLAEAKRPAHALERLAPCD
jgi:hypothetical protein